MIKSVVDQVVEHESYEAEVVHAARQYIKLRNRQAARFGLASDHSSAEGKALHAAVTALDKYEANLKVN